MRALIVGAGLGGLCLAHGLRRAGIDLQILERGSGPADRPAGYGIHLNADGLRSLHACLPTANWDQLVASAAPARDVVRFLDQHLNILAVRDNETSRNGTDPITRRRAVSREALRDALLLGLNVETHGPTDAVQWGRPFERYEHTGDGRVRAHTADGSGFTADLLVGADGSNSRVRRQRLPDLQRQDLGILTVAGRVPLTVEIAGGLPPALLDGAVINIVPPGPGWMFLSTWHNASATPDETPSVPARNPSGHLVWAWTTRRDSVPANIDDLTPPQLRDVATERIENWAPALRHLVTVTDPTTITAVPLRTMPALQKWEPSAVTLLGDAIHNMTPMAGIGANTALRDADELRRVLLTPGSHTITARIGAYEEHMCLYANQALALSTRNARTAASSARLPRLAFRTALRVAEAVPPFKRRMLAATR